MPTLLPLMLGSGHGRAEQPPGDAPGRQWSEVPSRTLDGPGATSSPWVRPGPLTGLMGDWSRPVMGPSSLGCSSIASCLGPSLSRWAVPEQGAVRDAGGCKEPPLVGAARGERSCLESRAKGGHGAVLGLSSRLQEERWMSGLEAPLTGKIMRNHRPRAAGPTPDPSNRPDALSRAAAGPVPPPSTPSCSPSPRSTPAPCRGAGR